MKEFDIAIIGGGAAGLFAAARATYMVEALQRDDNQAVTMNSAPRIALLEKMPRPGRKINITGKGRCNLTNAAEWNDCAPHIHPNSNFFKHAFYNLTPKATMEFFEAMGLELEVERGRRVFPKSHRAMDVTDTLVKYIKSGGCVDLITDFEVKEIVFEGTAEENIFKITGIASGVDEKCGGTQVIEAKRVIIATGGKSYPTTGSSGAGYEFAKRSGHTVVKTLPSLTALTPKGYNAKLCQGVQLKNVMATLEVNGREVQSEFGEAEFTDGGLEGALGFRLSRRAVRALDEGQKVVVVIDLKPSLSEEQLRAKIQRIVAEIHNTIPSTINSTTNSTTNSSTKRQAPNIKHILPKLLPSRVVDLFLNRYMNSFVTNNDIANDKVINELPYLLKNLRFEIAGCVGYERCVVTQGGVSLKEVSPKTMESKLVKGLYFAGETLDLDGDTGGYNLQIAFSTAASAIANALRTGE